MRPQAAGCYHEDLRFSLRDRLSPIVATLSVELLVLGIEIRNVLKDDVEWRPHLTMLGITPHPRYPVEISIHVQDGVIDVALALDTSLLDGDEGSVLNAVRTLDFVLSDLTPVITATMKANRASDILPVLPGALSDDVPF